MEQTAQEEILGNAATVLPQNTQNVPSLHTIKTLSVMKWNAILMQDEDEFDIEKFKGFKPKKALIYTEKSIYELEN